jgi:predicted phage terminase large subunit-like protein
LLFGEGVHKDNGITTVQFRWSLPKSKIRRWFKLAKTKDTSLISQLIGSNNEQIVEDWEYSLWDEYAKDFPEVLALKGKRPFTGATGLRRMLGEKSMEYFARAYFPDYIPTAPPSFHQEWFCDLKSVAEKNGGSSMVRAAPRGHAKTTIWDFVFPLWCICYMKKRYLLIISDAYDQAKGFISNIKDEIENNERIDQDFGNLVGEPWQEGSITCSNGVKIDALGAGMKIRGRKNKNFRPDLIILDDVENDDNAATHEQRKKLKNWYKKAVRHAGARYTDFVFIGTVLHDDSLLSELLETPGYDSKKYQAVISFATRDDLWDEWKKKFTNLNDLKREDTAEKFFEENRVAMLEGAEILWDANNPKFPKGYYSLMVTKITDGEEAFASELQNDPKSSEDQIFQPKYYSNSQLPPLNVLDVVIAVDPSLGQTDKSDFSAIIGVGTDRITNQMYVLEADIKRRAPDIIIAALFDIASKYFDINNPPRVVGIEDVQFQAFFRTEVKRRAQKNGMPLNIVPIKNTVNKEIRIESLQPLVNNGYVLLHPSQTLLIQQLTGYPRAKKDGPDALEMAIRLASNKPKKDKKKNQTRRRVGWLN